MALKGFVHAVVDDLLRQVIGAVGIGVHTRPLSDRLKTFKHFDGISFVTSHKISRNWMLIERMRGSHPARHRIITTEGRNHYRARKNFLVFSVFCCFCVVFAGGQLLEDGC